MNLQNIKQKKQKINIISINVIGRKSLPSLQTQLKYKALEKGTFLQEI